MLYKVISGGQTGADQGGLLAAWRFGLETGGTAPSNWWTDKGSNFLLETLGLSAGGSYQQRTKENVRNSDGTLLFTLTPDSPGSVLTRKTALAENKPFLEISGDIVKVFHEGFQTLNVGEFNALVRPDALTAADWIEKHRVMILNVAGNRERSNTTQVTAWFLTNVLNILKGRDLVLVRH